jgi:3-oxoacyl-[acyl-carrier protein] reductase
MLKGKVAMITGGAKGIGRYIAHNLAGEGAKIAISDIDLERMKKTEGELKAAGAEVLAQKCDVRDEDQVRSFMNEAAARFGTIDVLVNNAGIVTHFGWGVPRWPLIRDMEKSFWDKVMETNLNGTFLCTKHALPYMQKQRSGHVINLYGGSPPKTVGSCVYSVSKDGIRTFTRFVAEEMREWNICVVAVSPGGAIATEDAPEEIRAKMPGPESAGDRFILAAEAGMDLSGQRLTLKNGKLEIDAR